MNFQTNLRKALTTSGAGAALLPYDLDPMLHEELLDLQPLATLLETVPAGSKTHEYSVRSSHPAAWFEGELTPANALNSVYARKTVQTKIQRIWGSVSGFAQAMDEAFVDALAAELEGSVEGMANVLEYGSIWGTSTDQGFTGDAYQYSGIVASLFNNAAASNVIDASGTVVSLSFLDQALAAVAGHRGVRTDPYVWLMGIRMKQVVDGLQTKVQIPLTQMELEDGKIVMAAYGNVPIFETDYLTPASTTSSPSDLAATAAAGGALADDEYFYRIASVTIRGEQIASNEDSATTATTNNSVDLTWTADANAYLYFIFRGLATGADNLQLLDIIPAKTYDSAGTVSGTVATYSDEGTKTPIANINPLSAGEQNILIVNRNPRRGAAFVGKVDDMGRAIDQLFSFVELARVKDTFDYMVKGYLALRLIHPNLAGMIRRVTLV
jgi:hypothetical protein